ncbi:RimK family alpha-L-glutamate ligase [Natronomonas gomsonensis]|jgi:RimK family alpha-L-glutamate ligase|uniref:RimK family alpha-L-glutamate ligase n=1 Tax=Natronomonas gomsonensis TaxID=1046043 RepID=UPI0020CA789D|nr:RimK family alpha-L-glutamate ligase [Natronomonas gomsonensis]MCY4729083.1 RimK family alpha-L-glutamate ligase [Natronomonas gomsonensis]
MSSDLTVGVLSLHSSKESKAILNAVEQLGYDTEWLREQNTAVEIENGEVTLEPEVDIVVNRLLLSKEEQPAEALGLATMLDRMRPMLNTPTSTMTAIHKFATGTALAEAGIQVPDALLALSGDTLNDRREKFGDEVVYKTAIGTHGGGTWKLDTDDPVNPMVGSRQAFLQELIEHDEKRHHDLRIYTVGGRVVGAMNRYAPEGEWRTNVALGGAVEDATDDLPEEVVTIAERATDVVGLDYAGVDIVQGEDGYYVLEVNPTAGFKGLFEATGRSPAPHIARLAIERAGGEVDEERVYELSANLDDSRPACMPRKKSPEPAKTVVIGYIEEVVAMGTSGSKTVLAKSDTGATRTSIDARLAADIGTGPIKDIVKIKSGSVKSGRSRPVVDLVVGIGGTQHTVTASIEDRSHMDYPLLLGRDILQHYQVDVMRRADDDEPESLDEDLLEE